MIGIFDSGSGGLTVLRALRETLPSADVAYFGDIKNAPYGEKPHEELSLLTVNALRFLTEHGATSIISACNSVSGALALSLFDVFDLAPTRMIEMVGPTVAHFKDFEGTMLLCATPATVRSGIYQNAFRMVGKDVAALPLPRLAGAIEFGAAEEELEDLIAKGLADRGTFDVVILACTHYPLALDVFERLCPATHFFDPARAVAQRAQRLLWPMEVGEGTTHFYLSKDSPCFRGFVERLFPGAGYDLTVVE